MWDWTVALVTLTALEIVLGIDNIVLISVVVEKLPAEMQSKARKIGLALALITRLILLSMIAWLSRLTTPLFTLLEQEVSTRDLILIVGGLFLVAKATTEIYSFVEAKEESAEHGAVKRSGKAGFSSIMTQIVIFDVIFSLDSVLTAIGLAKDLSVMVAAVIIAIVVMIVFADAIGTFVSNNPGIKTLALSFLIMIGVLLMAEGFGSHFNRGYVYFAMAFSLVIELLNRRRRNKDTRTAIT